MDLVDKDGKLISTLEMIPNTEIKKNGKSGVLFECSLEYLNLMITSAVYKGIVEYFDLQKPKTETRRKSYKSKIQLKTKDGYLHSSQAAKMLGISVATLCNRTKDGIINSVNSQGIPISNTNGIKMPRYYSLEEIERARPEIEEKIKLWEIFHGKRK